MERKKMTRTGLHAAAARRGRRAVSLLLSMCMMLSMFSGWDALIPAAYADEGSGGSTRAAGTSGVTRQADASTMDDYKNMLDFSKNTRYAGRIWSDKTVFALGDDVHDNDKDWSDNTLTLNPADDGVTAATPIELQDDFMHVYSVLGSSLEMRENTPLDVMFVVDVSGSMGKLTATAIATRENFATSPIYQTVETINTTINQLLEASPDSRFGIAIYGTTSAILVPLGHYEKSEESDPYLTTEFIGPYGTQGLHYSLTAKVTPTNGGPKQTYYADNAGDTSDAAHGTNNSSNTGSNRLMDGTGGNRSGTGTRSDDPIHVGHITNPQAGLSIAMDQFIQNEELTWTAHDGKDYLRVPALIHLTDGQASDLAWIQPTADESGDAWKRTVSNWNNVNWAYDLAYNSLINDKGDSDADRYNAYQLTGAGDTAPVIFQTLLTAAYYKTAVEAFYNHGTVRDTSGQPVKLRCYSVYASDTTPYAGLGSQIKATVDAILEPTEYFTDADPASLTDSSGLDDSATEAQFIDTAYELYKLWRDNAETGVIKEFNTKTTSSGSNNITFSLNANKNQTSTGMYATAEGAWKDDITAEKVETNINYVPEGNFYHTGFEGLTDVFSHIVQELVDTMFAPVSGANDLGVNDTLTYVDPVGKYMDVKDVKNLVLFGKNYDITKTAVYDYQWNRQYMANKESNADSTTPLTAGWYLGDPLPTNTADGNANVTYQSDTPEVGAKAAWAAGWVYRISYSAASMYVPTLEGINADDSPAETVAKLRNTEYTFYRIEGEATDRRTLHVNPVYLEEGQEEADYLEGIDYDQSGARTHLATPGVYALDDLRIWVEDSGDFNESSSGLETDTTYDEALWVDIPSNMLPLRKITVSAEDGSNLQYTTNLANDGSEAYKASFPLRVIYTVGVSSDALEAGNRINVAGALSAEYLKDNKITTEAAAEARGLAQGTVEFFSNWYNPENRYSDYAISSIDYTFGDPVTSFSPAPANRYYMFEKALPLYSNAYVYVKKEGEAGQWRRVRINEEETQDTRTFQPAEFGGVLRAQDLEVTGGAGNITNAETATEKINDALNKLSTHINAEDLKDGDIVLLADDVLDNVQRPTDPESENDPFASDSYFYLAIEYYNLENGVNGGSAKPVQFAITRKGSEFGSAYASSEITNGDMLCWHDRSGQYPDYPYLSYTETSKSTANAGVGDSTRGKDFIGWPLDGTGYYKEYSEDEHAYPKDGLKYADARGSDTEYNTDWNTQHKTVMEEGDWVVCAKPGALRVGDLAQSIQQKQDSDDDTPESYPEYAKERFPDKVSQDGSFTVQYYQGNVTRTANNYYMPTISSTSDISDVKVNVYLGNNGRLYVMDTTLLVTKTVAPPEGSTEAVDSDEVFNYQIFLNQDDIESLSAVVVHWNANTKSWQRQYHYIDLQLDGQRFLQTTDGQKAMFDAYGNRVVANGDGYVYAPETGEQLAGKTYNAGTLYYAYIGKNSSTEVGATDTSFRVYHNNDVDNNGTVSTGDVTTGGATSGGTVTFSTKKAWLVSQNDYDTVWNPEGGPALDPVSGDVFDPETTGKGKLIPSLSLLTLNPNIDATTDITIETPYLTNTAYWTRAVTFGVNANDDGDGKQSTGANLDAENDLYDSIIPKADRSDYFGDNKIDNAYIAARTAEFSLKHGEALLFSGIPSATVYRVTEKLTDAQKDAGYTLKEVSHNQQVGSTSTYRPGIQQIPVYYGGGSTYGEYGGKDAEGNYIYPSKYAGSPTEKDLRWAVDMDGNANDDQYLHYEPFHHTNAVVWDAYSTMSATAQGDNHHQPDDENVQDGTSVFWLWDETTGTSINTQTTYGVAPHTVADNPSCYDMKDGGADEDVGGGQVRHYFFKDGELRDVHYEGEGSGYIRNIGRYITSPTVHFGVEGETQTYAMQDMPGFTQSADYTGVYSVFGNTGTFEESVNFVNTIENNKRETAINGDTGVIEGDGTGTQPGVQENDTITYTINWANGTQSEARVVIVDQLDAGVDFVSAGNGGKYYATQAAANAALEDIYGVSKKTPTVDSGRVVIWDLGMRATGAADAVTLTVKVNSNAPLWWDYDGDGVADKPYDGETDDPDYLVRDRATVRVADNAYYTDTVLNPVGQPDKTETKVERGTTGTQNGYDDVDPVPDATEPAADGKWHGPLVFPGDKITYEIEWRNYENTDATVTIRDPLDENVRFVSASYVPGEILGADGEPIKDPKPADEQTATGTDTDESVNSGVTANGYKGDAPYTIAYDNATHTVTWSLGSMPSQSSGKVTLVVEVLDSATPAGYVDNTAYVKVGDRNEQQTRTWENPTPHDKKEEVTPGDGVMVQIGDPITYEITWQNYKSTNARVIVMDTLDPGVDYESSDGGTYYKDGGEVPADGAMPAVDIPAHTVVWVLPDRAPNEEGKVTLTVRVNRNAKLDNVYNAEADGLAPDPALHPDGTDFEVLDQARVKVENDSFLKTQIVENPVPEKTETRAGEHDPAELAPKEGTDNTETGPLVFVGDEIVYKITYKNGHDEPATVRIVDPLDPGVTFTSATPSDKYTYNEKTHTVTWVLDDQPAGETGYVTLTVTVNEKATPAGIVDNQASVKVNGDPFIDTEIIENPTPHMEKTEVTPGEGMQVMPGDEIDYSITWHNYEEGEADVIVTDKLDPGVDFVSATAEGNSITNENTEKPTTANLAIQLKADGDIDEAEEFKFTLDLAAPEGAEALAAEYAWAVTHADGSEGTTGTWSEANKELTLKPGENVTVSGLPVGTLYTLTPAAGGDAIVKDGTLGLYGSAVTVTVTGTQPAAMLDLSIPVVPPEDTVDEAVPAPAEQQAEPQAEPQQTVPQIVVPQIDPQQNGPEIFDPQPAPHTDEPETGSEPESEAEAVSGQDTAGEGDTPEGVRRKNPITAPADGQTTLNLGESAPAGEAVHTEATPAPQGENEADGDEDKMPAAAPAPTDPAADGQTDTTGTDTTVTDPTGTDTTGTETGEDGQTRSTGEESAPGADTTAGETEQTTDPSADTPSADEPGTEQPGPDAPQADAPAENDPNAPSADEPGDGDDTTLPGEGSQDADTPDEAGTTEPGPDGGAAEPGAPDEGVPGAADDEAAPNGSETVPPEGEEAQDGTDTAAIYTFSAVVEDLPAPEDETVPEDVPMPMALETGETGFDPKTEMLNGETAVSRLEFKDSYGFVRIYYFAKAHTVVWVLTNRPANAEDSVGLKVRVNEDAEKFWSYEHPDWGPAENQKDDRVRNQAGVKVGDNPEVKTRIIENPTKPEKTETNINDTDVSRDIVAGEDGYIGPEVHVDDTITYRITWQNNAADENGQLVKAKITIVDPLDTNVDFVSASDPYTYDPATHTVTWDLGEREPRDRGFVTLTVRVTERALQPGYVENQATVWVGNDAQVTDRIENPIEKLSNLIVTKTVTGNVGDITREWHFRVELGLPLNGQYGDMYFERGVAEFTLRHGDSAAALGLPADIYYTVTEREAEPTGEANAEGYETEVNGAKGNAASGVIPGGETAEADYVNRKELPPPEPDHGHLIVTKKVDGTLGDTTKEWHFRVELSDRSINGVFGDMSFVDGVAEFTLKHGQSAAALNLPKDITYTVTEREADQDGYTTTPTGDTGTIVDQTIHTAEFLNTKEPPPPGSNSGHLVVTKTVTGTAGETDRDWHFRVELSDTGINGAYGDMTFAGGVAEFTLKHGQSAMAKDLPADVAYTVTEAEAGQDGYTTTPTGETGTIPNGGTANAAFENHRDTPNPEPTPGPEPTPEPESTPNPNPEPTPNPNPGTTPAPDGSTPGETPPPQLRIPQTGDDSPLGLWLALLVISGIGLCITAVVYKNSKGRKARKNTDKP